MTDKTQPMIDKPTCPPLTRFYGLGQVPEGWIIKGYKSPGEYNRAIFSTEPPFDPMSEGCEIFAYDPLSPEAVAFERSRECQN